MTPQQTAIIDKIKKLLALSASSNEHEAAAAGRDISINAGINQANGVRRIGQ